MEFKRATLKDYYTLEKYIKNNSYRACELSVANNIIWADYYRVYYIIVEDMLVFAKLDESKKPEMVSYPIGAGDERKAFDALVAYFQANKLPFAMYLVSKEKYEAINSWYPGIYSIEYDRDEADYLYEYETLAKLRGKKLHGKRNHINRFLENHPDYEYEEINSENAGECLRLAEKWEKEKESDEETASVEFELTAIEFALANMQELKLKGALIRVEGQICAFTIGEQLTKDTFLIHFEKACKDIQGAYTMINREFVRRALKGYSFINREEDMGLPGLRHAKTSYQPVCLIEKGIITLAH